MQLDIKYKYNPVKFDTLDLGEFFLFSDLAFIRIEYTEEGYNSVRVVDGRLVYIEDDEEVRKVSKVIIEE